MAASRQEGAQHFAGPVTFGAAVTFQGATSLPASSVGNAQIPAGAGIDYTKVNHLFTVDRQLFEPATAIAAKTELLKIVRGAAGVVVAFQAAIATNPTGADRTVSVDLQKSTGGGAFATILTAPIQFTDVSVDRTAVAAVISNTALVAGDILQAVVTVAGVAGAQAAGLVVSLTQAETPA